MSEPDIAVTVVWQLSLAVSSGSQDYVDTVPYHYCGRFGCSVQYQTYVNAVRQATGSATLTVQEGRRVRATEGTFCSTRTGDR